MTTYPEQRAETKAYDFDEGEKGGIIALNFSKADAFKGELSKKENANDLASLAVEEVVHAVQYDKGMYGNGKANIEFEAKSIVGQIQAESRKDLYTTSWDKSANAYGVAAFASGNAGGYQGALKSWHSQPNLPADYKIMQRTQSPPSLLLQLINPPKK